VKTTRLVPARIAASAGALRLLLAVGAWLGAGATGMRGQAGSRIKAPAMADAGVFWLAPDKADRAAARDRLSLYDLPVLGLVEVLREVPAYPADPPRGRLDRAHRNADGTVHPFTVLVPDGYRPDRDWPVRVWLHGGIGRPAWTETGGWWRDHQRVADPERIVVLPASWNESRWWQESQVESLAAILDELAREYRIDRNRVHMLGVSDGGTGVYYHAARAATPWASFLAFIGHAAVLSNPRLGVDGQIYVTNLRNRPLFIVNGGRDRLYPTSSVEPFIQLFRDNDVPFIYRPQPEAGHDLSWISEEAARIDSFTIANPRDPLPDRVEWEAEGAASGRFAWVSIDEIGDVPGQSDLPGRNELTVDGRQGEYLAFPHRLPSGRLEAVREGNSVRVLTDRVARFRVFVSPDEFELSRPIRIQVNGRVVHDAVVEPSAPTLLARAEQDRDRTSLFVAEIEIDLRP